MQIKTDGIVLREVRYNDSDRLLTILSGEHGLLYAFARGADRMKSRMSAATKQLCYSDFILYESKERCLVDTAETKTVFLGLSRSLENYSLANYLAQLCIYLAPQTEDSRQILRLLLNCLYMLDQNKRRHTFIKPLFELRLMTVCGFMPNLLGCRECLCYEAPAMLFLPGSGEILCERCAKQAEIPMDAQWIDPTVLTAMRHIVLSDFEKLFSFRIPEETLAQLGRVTEQYVMQKLEHHFSTLDFYHSICLPDPLAGQAGGTQNGEEVSHSDEESDYDKS